LEEVQLQNSVMQHKNIQKKSKQNKQFSVPRLLYNNKKKTSQKTKKKRV